jgi:hypothetical protein
MNRLVKLCVFSAVVVAGSLFSASKVDAGYGYGYGYGHGYGYRASYHYAPHYYAPVYVAPVYNYGYGYGGFCY